MKSVLEKVHNALDLTPVWRSKVAVCLNCGELRSVRGETKHAECFYCGQFQCFTGVEATQRIVGEV